MTSTIAATSAGEKPTSDMTKSAQGEMQTITGAISAPRLQRNAAPIDFLYLVGLVLAASIATYSFAAVHFHIHEGGMGDESHRLVLAFRLTPDLSPTWQMFLSQPWPPLPYILQVLTHRLLRVMMGITDRQFAQSALLCSITLYALHLVVVLEICRRLGATLAGLLYVAGAVSADTIVALSVSAMAEPPALFFLAMAGLLLTFEPSILVAAAAGLMFMAASLCRSEIAVFGVFTAGIFLVRYGLFRSFVFGSMAISAAAYKVFYNSGHPGGMSYFDLKKFYWMGDSIAQRLGFLWDNFRAAAAANGHLIYPVILAIVALAAQIIPLRSAKKMRGWMRSARLNYALGAAVVGISATLFIIGLCGAGMISWDVRYELIPLSIAFFSVCLFAAPEVDQVRNYLQQGAMIVLIVALAIAGASGAIASLNALQDATPPELRQARDIIVHDTGPGKWLVVDALMFWDTYPFMNAVIEAGATNSACAYDHPHLTQTAGMIAAVARGESRKTVDLLAYIDQYEPAILATAGSEWRKGLDTIPRFMDHDERASYILPSISWESPDKGTLSLTKIGSTKRFSVTKIFENKLVRLYRLARIGN